MNNDPARALENYDAALALKPDSVPALRQAAAVAEQRGELERSLSYWLRAKKLEPEDPEILLGFGACACGWICWTMPSPRSSRPQP